MTMNDPREGWHWNYCECGEVASKTTHFGGKNEIKCSWCPKFTMCVDCVVKGNDPQEGGEGTI